MDDIRYSEDLKDALALANQWAKKSNRSTATDRDYLLGLLSSQRQFNRLDTLLKAMNVPGKQLRQRLRLAEPASLPASAASLQQAEQLARDSRNGSLAKTGATVEVEHLLKAFCHSSDPAIQQALQDYQVSPERIDASVAVAHRKKGWLTTLFIAKELGEVIVFVVVFLILIKSFLGELRLIPSESMVPGLQINDRLVIERVTRVNRPYQRGDILVFYPPMTQLKNDPVSLFLRLTGLSGVIYKKDDNIDVAYIKRLIGLPGDTVDVRPGVGVFINGKLLDEPYVNEIAYSCTQVAPVKRCQPVTVPAHSYYMMGDNRNWSMDSRYWGFAEDDRVIGRAIFRVWPLNRVGLLPPAPAPVRQP